MAVVTQIQLRRGTASQWTSANPILAAGEMGFETDTGKAKIGDGSTAWNSLSYSIGGVAVGNISGLGTGVATWLATPSSSNLASAVTDETGTGSLVFGTSPTIATPRIQLGFNAQTGTTYTLVLADASSKWVTLSNASAITLTVPPSVFSAGDSINIQQIGAGQVTLSQGSGVTITSTGATSTAPKLRAQYSSATIICTASNTFTVVGDIS